jgi:hypothetical protein
LLMTISSPALRALLANIREGEAATIEPAG